MDQVNWFDIVTASLILIIGIKGIFNGLIKELSGLIGIVLGVWLASTYAAPFGGWIGDNLLSIDSQPALKTIGFLSLLSLIWLSAIILGILISKLVSLSGLGLIDKILGLLFASAKVFMILSVIIFALSNIDFVKQNTKSLTDKSLLYPLFIQAGEAIIHIDTSELLEDVETIKTDSEAMIKDGSQQLLQKSANMIKDTDGTQ